MGFRILGVQIRYFREQWSSPTKEFEPLRLLVAFSANHAANDCDYQATQGDCCRNNRNAHGWLRLAETMHIMAFRFTSNSRKQAKKPSAGGHLKFAHLAAAGPGGCLRAASALGNYREMRGKCAISWCHFR